MTKEFKDRWMVPGDELRTNVPVILSKTQYDNNSYLRYGYNAYNYSDVRIAKGDFIRMKEISLQYDFPKTWIKPLNNLSETSGNQPVPDLCRQEAERSGS